MLSQQAQRLVSQIESKDLSTAAHTWRVVLYTRALAEQFTSDTDVLRRITFGAALHDIGKIDIPTEILQKPARLTDAEFAVIKSHPAIGHQRLVAMGETDPLVLDLVRYHHERPDGLGYPDGLRGDEIPVVARYFAVIDSFDALTSIRPYRSDVGPGAADRALTEIESHAGVRYWAPAVERFASLQRGGDLDWIQNYFNDRCELPSYCGGDTSEGLVRQVRDKRGT